jgi:hypothetical protein
MSQWQETLRRELYGTRGGHDPALQKAIGEMPADAAMRLFYVIRDLKDQIDTEKRKARRGY